MNDYQSKLEKSFLSEYEEIFSSLENDILNLEKNPENQEIKKTILRRLHTLKGSCGMVENNYIVNYIHLLESVIKSELYKNKVNYEIFTFFLKQLDYISYLITQILKKKSGINETEYLKNIEILKSYSLKNEVKTISDSNYGFFSNQKDELSHLEENENKIYRITFKLTEKRYDNTWYPDDLINDISKLGKIINISGKPSESIDWSTMNINQCYFFWIILLQSNRNLPEIKDVFLFFIEKNEINIEELSNESISLIGEILISEGKIKKEDIENILNSRKKIGQMLIDEHKINEKDLENALKKQDNLRHDLKIEDELKIPTKKIDIIMDLVGELIITNSNLNSIKDSIENMELEQVQNSINKISKQLHDVAFSMKMVPISQLLIKFNRMIRDLSIEFGKKINLIIEGENTELDKSLFSSLYESLLHIIRNAIDHGIEVPEERLKLGKSEAGLILIRAYEESGEIIIEISDDGKGLNKEKIFKKAIEKKILKESVIYTEDEIYNIIFESGFSTTEKANLVSGRGIGLEVVKSELKKVNGVIEIKTEKNKGTLFRIKLPLTLAIIEGFMIKSGFNHFIIPLNFILECFEINLDLLNTNDMIYNLRGKYLKIISLEEIFNNYQTNNQSGIIKKVVVIKFNNELIGILADEILGNIQAVIKPLIKMINRNMCLIGSSILGNGEIALIIDVRNLLKKYKNEAS